MKIGSLPQCSREKDWWEAGKSLFTHKTILNLPGITRLIYTGITSVKSNQKHIRTDWQNFSWGGSIKRVTLDIRKHKITQLKVQSWKHFSTNINISKQINRDYFYEQWSCKISQHIYLVWEGLLLPSYFGHWYLFLHIQMLQSHLENSITQSKNNSPKHWLWFSLFEFNHQCSA